jgi:hypothetical protein
MKTRYYIMLLLEEMVDWTYYYTDNPFVLAHFTELNCKNAVEIVIRQRKSAPINKYENLDERETYSNFDFGDPNLS